LIPEQAEAQYRRRCKSGTKTVVFAEELAYDAVTRCFLLRNSGFGTAPDRFREEPVVVRWRLSTGGVGLTGGERWKLAGTGGSRNGWGKWDPDEEIGMKIAAG
jgi:hypothetical protein